MRLPLAGLLALACLVLSASTASAWTRTTVESVRAHLDVQEPGGALVLLEVELRVRGGWLSHFELHDLGEGVVLDADKPPWLVGEDGRKYVPDARVRKDGRVEISFPRRSRAPWRGRYTLGVLYHLPLPIDPESGTASWALPAWHVDLQNVVVQVEGADGLTLVDAGAENVEVVRRARGARAHVRATRAQLPRTLRWELTLGLPGAVLEPPATQQARAASDAPFSGAHLLACVVLGLLAWLKRGFARDDARRRGAIALPLLPLGRPELGAAVILGCGIAAGWLHGTHPRPALALVLLTASMGLTRGFRLASAPTGQRRRAVAALDVMRARRQRLHTLLGMRAWLDASTPPGGLLLLASGALALASTRAQVDVIWLECWLAAVPLFLNATRLQLPRGDAETLLRLGRLKPRLAQALAAREARLVVRVDHDGARPELEVQLTTPVAGLRGLRLCAGHGQWQGAAQDGLLWLAVAERGSAADGRLARALPHAQVMRSGDRALTARCARVAEASAELPVLLDWMDPARSSAPPEQRDVRSAA